MGLIGHNGGPGLEGHAFRRLAWTKARAALMPRLPVEVVRLRVRRAAELGLDYSTYAGIRAQTGHDVIALLFSTNALRMLRPGQGDAARIAALSAVKAGRALAVAPPMPVDAAAADLNARGLPLDCAGAAPGLLPWPALRERIADLRRNWPADRVLLIAETMGERDWVEAGRLAGHIPANRYFA
ncbi:hypothetical protein [Falsirhodobacter algicola]|uniref:Uncharacterized protein n=1 Tax=Falsirhodobacter algicola TaxID=2692330 RepID=A0A8J8MQP9_9RHOB|nr:hypothetical protein [Falsirhodobacter algicola]QUS34950.1 hypothetical protein GR316_00875 [Falsirhodobacter algicola]